MGNTSRFSGDVTTQFRIVTGAQEKSSKASLNQKSTENQKKYSMFLGPILKLPITEINSASNQSHFVPTLFINKLFEE